MTRVKICGITSPQDAALAVALGADAIGIIGVPSSPRYVASETSHAIAEAVGPFVPLVVVVQHAVDALGYAHDLVQFYEGPAPNDGRALRVFRIKDAASLLAVSEFHEPVRGLLLDTYHERALGGLGESFDWALAEQAITLRPDLPILLAGGLTPETVAEAVRRVRPYAVDVASGVEASIGRKDPEKLRAFIHTAHNA